MTENEAIKRIKEQACNDRFLAIHCDDSCLYGAEKCEWAHAIKALEEIQEYRAIGTVKQIRIKQAEFTVLSERYLNDLGKLREYQSIGTPEEFNALKEKAEPKKVIDKNENEYTVDFMCPSCNEPIIGQPYRPNYCKHCGCKLDWT